MYDEALAKSIANQVIQHVDEFGHIADGVVQRYADEVPCDPSTIYRWLRKYCGWTAPKTALNPKNVAPILHAHAGNIAATYRTLNDMGVDGLQSESSFRRFIKSNPQMIRMHAYTTKGKEGLDNVTSYVRMHVDHRNDLWQGDHTELDIFVHVSGRRKPIKPWLTTIVDCKTRLVVAHALTTGNTPNSEVICGTLAKAVKLRTVTLDGRELDGGDIGGIPSALRHDRGADWESNRVKEVLAAWGIEPRRTTYTNAGHQNGRVERWHRTINQQFCSNLPGYTGGGENHKRERQYLGDAKNFLLFTEFARLMDQFVIDYNRRPHSSLGNRSPLETWLEEADRPLREPSPEMLRAAMMKVDSIRKVQKDGINYKNRKFHSPLLPPEGEVRLRHYPYEFNEIEVYDEHGEWLCTAPDVKHLTETEMAELFKRRGRQFREVKQAASLGHDLRNGAVSMGDGGMIADIPDKNDPNSNGNGDVSSNGSKTNGSKRGADGNGTESSTSPTSDADIDAALKGLEATP